MSLARGHELHLVVACVVEGGGARHGHAGVLLQRAFTEVALGRRLPVSDLALDEWSVLVGAEQVPMEVLPPHVPGGDGSYFPLRASVGEGVCVVLAVDVPGVGHHEVEVGVVVDVGRDVGVVLDELLEGDLAVALLVVHHVVMHFEGFQKLLEHLVFRLFAALHVRVLAGIVFPLNVFDCESSISIVVYLLECLSHKLCSELIHWTYHNSDELVKIYVTIPIQIERFEQIINILFWNIDLEILDAFLKLVHIECA